MGFRVPYSNRLLEASCNNGLCKKVLLGFAHRVNEFRSFCEDSIILWPNFGSNVISIFVKTQVG